MAGTTLQIELVTTLNPWAHLALYEFLALAVSSSSLLKQPIDRTIRSLVKQPSSFESCSRYDRHFCLSSYFAQYHIDFLKMLVHALISLLQAVRLTIASPEPPLPGYGVEELMWSVDAQDGLPSVTLNGTVQEVHQQTLQINPAFKLKRNLTRRSPDVVPASSAFTDLICMNFPLAACPNLQDGARYLETVPGVPLNGAGPGNCGRVSCSYGAGE
jgi:hypothetical protein